VRERDTRLPVERDDPHEPLLSGHLEQHAGEVEIVLDDEHDAIAGLYGVTVVGCRLSWLRPGLGTGDWGLGTLRPILVPPDLITLRLLRRRLFDRRAARQLRLAARAIVTVRHSFGIGARLALLRGLRQPRR